MVLRHGVIPGRLRRGGGDSVRTSVGMRVGGGHLRCLLTLCGVSISSLLSLLGGNEGQVAKTTSVDKSSVSLKILGHVNRVFSGRIDFFRSCSGLSAGTDDDVFFHGASFKARLGLRSVHAMGQFRDLGGTLSTCGGLSRLSIGFSVRRCALRSSPGAMTMHTESFFCPKRAIGRERFLIGVVRGVTSRNVFIFRCVRA